MWNEESVGQEELSGSGGDASCSTHFGKLVHGILLLKFSDTYIWSSISAPAHYRNMFIYLLMDI